MVSLNEITTTGMSLIQCSFASVNFSDVALLLRCIAQWPEIFVCTHYIYHHALPRSNALSCFFRSFLYIVVQCNAKRCDETENAESRIKPRIFFENGVPESFVCLPRISSSNCSSLLSAHLVSGICTDPSRCLVLPPSWLFLLLCLLAQRQIVLLE